MITPERISEDLVASVFAFLFGNCDRTPDHEWVCRNCKGPIQAVDVAFSLHDSGWGNLCAGAGQVKWIPIPYCPGCETLPRASGCIHVPGTVAYVGHWERRAPGGTN